jgi:hypothetical protein
MISIIGEVVQKSLPCEGLLYIFDRVRKGRDRYKKDEQFDFTENGEELKWDVNVRIIFPGMNIL